MDSQKSKENILNKIRKALQQSVPLPFPEAEGEFIAYPSADEDLAVIFGEKFTGLGGKFAYCINESDAIKQIRDLIAIRKWKEVYCTEGKILSLFSRDDFIPFSTRHLADSDVSITTCEALVARTGSMVLSSFLKDGRTASVYAPVHICIAKTSELVFDIEDALKLIKLRYNDALPSLISFATGPSRTADIEKTLVVGVHGPKEVFCFLIEDL